ncbi:hypothetical protein [Microbacterium sp. SORGH_AS_0888]|uniref:hypothetical protein n=1 Tax=Microbacterium sp. SORGH_AS_0888 TaxID=3041791 RepID=UPI002782746D|nr:hypothetical protein [Microbacterium sp. SORGH_AS_0888]MDQ1130500.1 hypothetical protein [Microbacterium sp. SORGH_AS_0888]
MTRKKTPRSAIKPSPVRPGYPWWAYGVLVVVSVAAGMLVYVALTHDYAAVH